MNKHTSKGTAKTGSSLLFVCVWVNSYPLLKVHSLTHTNYFPGYPPIGINTIFFLICQPINSWPQQGFLGVRSPWKCVTLIPNIFPKKNPSQGVMDCAKICLDFSNKKKKTDSRPGDGGELQLKQHGYLTPDRRVRSRENDSNSLSFQHRCCSGFI